MPDVPVVQPERLRARVKARLSRVRAAKAAKSWVGYILDVAGLAALVTSIIGLVVGGTWAQGILAVALAVIAFGFVVLCYHLQVALERTRIDARGAVALRRAHAPLAKAANSLAFATSSLLNGREPAVFSAEAHEFATELAAAYTLITGAECRVTVKGTYDVRDSLDLGVRTLFSSETHSNRPRRGGVDLVRDNTDFSELLEHARDYWLAADISIMPGYVNSHYTREEIARGDTAYRSVLVWPVRVVTAEAPESSDVDLLGFLCVDSLEVGIFDADRDVSPGEILAHSLYPSLRLFKQSSQEREASRHRGEA